MKEKPRSAHKGKHPKTHLRLPDLEYSKTAVLNSLMSVDGRRGYGHAIDEFVDFRQHGGARHLYLAGTGIWR